MYFIKCISLIIIIIICNFYEYIYATNLPIKPESITHYAKVLQNNTRSSDIISEIGQGCIVLQLMILKNIFKETNTNTDVITSTAKKFQINIVKLFKFMSKNMNNSIGPLLINVYNQINEYYNVSNTPAIAKKALQILNTLLNNIRKSDFWNNNTNNTMKLWVKDKNQKYLVYLCEHLMEVFTVQEDYDSFQALLTSPVETDKFNKLLLYSGITTKYINFQDKPIKSGYLLFYEIYNEMLCIYNDFIKTIKQVDSISETGLETQENFTKFIFKEFTYFYEIFNIMNAFLLNLGGQNDNIYIKQMDYYHLEFRDYFGKFIKEYIVLDNYGNIDFYSSYIIIDEALKEHKNKYLTFLLLDSQQTNQYRMYLNDEDFFNRREQKCKPFDWITINFDTLETKIYTPNSREDMENGRIFSFMEKMNRIKYRYLIYEFSVGNLIDYNNFYQPFW